MDKMSDTNYESPNQHACNGAQFFRFENWEWMLNKHISRYAFFQTALQKIENKKSTLHPHSD